MVGCTGEDEGACGIPEQSPWGTGEDGGGMQDPWAEPNHQPVLDALSRQERPFLPRLLLPYWESTETTCTPQTQPCCSSRLATGVRFLDSLPGVRKTPALPGGGTGRMQASAPGWAPRAPSVWCGDLQLRQMGLNTQQGPRDAGRPHAGRRRERQPHPGGGSGSRAGPAGTVFTTGCPGGSGGQGGGNQGEHGDHS